MFSWFSSLNLKCWRRMLLVMTCLLLEGLSGHVGPRCDWSPVVTIFTPWCYSCDLKPLRYISSDRFRQTAALINTSMRLGASFRKAGDIHNTCGSYFKTIYTHTDDAIFTQYTQYTLQIIFFWNLVVSRWWMTYDKQLQSAEHHL